MRLLLVALCLVASIARGSMLTAQSGTLASAQTATGGSTNIVCVTTARSIVFTYTTSAGTATVDAEISCNGTTGPWIPVSNSSKDITGSDGAGLTFPQCCYRTNVTACSSCSVTTTYRLGADIQ